MTGRGGVGRVVRAVLALATVAGTVWLVARLELFPPDVLVLMVVSGLAIPPVMRWRARRYERRVREAMARSRDADRRPR